MNQVVIVGAGPAGIRCAQRLVAAGLKPIIIDENARGGGQIYRQPPPPLRRPSRELYGSEARKADALHETLARIAASIDYRSGTTAWGLHDGKLYTERQGRVEAIAFHRLILATGATDRVMPVEGWTRPGVFSLGGAQIALKAQGCAIGSSTALLGAGPLLYLVAYQYAKAGAHIAGVFNTTPLSVQLRHLPALWREPRILALGLYYRAKLVLTGITVHSGVTPLRIEGDPAVSAFVWRDASGGERRVDCNAVAIGYGLRSENQLPGLADAEFAFDKLTRQWYVSTDDWGRSSVQGLYVAGDGQRINGADIAEAQGRLAASAVLEDIGYQVDARQVGRDLGKVRRHRKVRQSLERCFPWPHHLAGTLADDVIACRCENITAGEVRRAATTLRAPEVNRAKALSRVGMGRCQGRVCGLAVAEVLADALRQDIASVGRLRPQSPVKPLHVVSESGGGLAA